MGIFDKDSALNPFDGHFMSRVGWGIVVSFVIVTVLGFIIALVLGTMSVTGGKSTVGIWTLLLTVGYLYAINVGLKFYEKKRCYQVNYAPPSNKQSPMAA